MGHGLWYVLLRLTGSIQTISNPFAVIYGGYQTVIYYTVLISQDVLHLSAGATAIRFLPMGAFGFAFSLGMGYAVQHYDARWLLLGGLIICAIAPLPTTMMPENDQSLYGPSQL